MLFYPLIVVHLPFPSVSCVVSSLPGTIAGVKALARHFHSHIGSTSLLVMALLGFRRFPFCHRGTTKSSHPFFIGMFHEINHPASSQCSRYLGSPKGSALRFHLPSPVRRRGREHRPWSLPRSSPSSQGHPGRRLEEFFWEHLEDSLVSTRD